MSEEEVRTIIDQLNDQGDRLRRLEHFGLALSGLRMVENRIQPPDGWVYDVCFDYCVDPRFQDYVRRSHAVSA